MELRHDVIRKLATSKSTDELLNAAIREKIYRSIIRPVISNKDWNIYLSIEKDMGPAIEKLGFDTSLRFYEVYIDDKSTSTRDFSRQRWIANAEDKIRYYKERDEEERILEIRTDLIKRKREWAETFSWAKSEQVIKDEIVKQLSPLESLPDDTKVKEEGGKWSFNVGGFEFTIYKSKRVVTVQDSNIYSVKFILDSQEVKSSDVEIYQESTPEGRIFSISLWHMSGNLSKKDDSTFLEIAVEGLEKPFIIKM
jgi:hypothetical protein